MGLLRRDKSESESSDDSDLKQNSTSAFLPSVQLQVQATGLNLSDFSCAGSRGAESIPVYRVSNNGQTDTSAAPVYVSQRPSLKSNSCALVDGATNAPLITTVYRWGPGRNPHMRILHSSSSSSQPLSVEQAVEGAGDGPEFEVTSKSVFSRARRMATPYGTFEWRYGGKGERVDANVPYKFLILDKLEVSGEARTRVAQLVRNEEFRTPGTGKYNEGNGGRLQISFQAWEGEGRDKKVPARELEAFVVAGCLCMLKKEVDRQKDNQGILLVG